MADKRILSIDDLMQQPPPTWMIEGLFEARSVVMLAGPPGSYKSFLAIDWALSIAAGRSWCGRRTMPAKVLYMLGEGKSSMIKRIEAWRYHYHPSVVETQQMLANFRVTFDVAQFAHKSSIDNLLAELEQEDFRPQVVVVDTLARAFVGMDENSQRDIGMLVESADRLRQLGMTVILLHHTAKNTEFGVKYRGSSAIMGAMDTAMTMVRESAASDRVCLNVSKQKDHDEGPPLYFQRLKVQPPGSEEDSIVLVPTIKVDERFSEEGLKLQKATKELVAAPFDSDGERAKELAKRFNISEQAARMRISRLRKASSAIT